MFISTGWGVSVVGIFIASTIIVMEVATAITGLPWKEVPHQSIYDGASFILMGIMTYLLNILYLNKRKERVLIDPASGETVILKNSDSLFFIPLKFWPLLFCLFAVGHFATFLWS